MHTSSGQIIKDTLKIYSPRRNLSQPQAGRIWTWLFPNEPDRPSGLTDSQAREIEGTVVKLTKRERQVISLIPEGLLNRGLASTYSSQRTVKPSFYCPEPVTNLQRNSHINDSSKISHTVIPYMTEIRRLDKWK